MVVVGRIEIEIEISNSNHGNDNKNSNNNNNSMHTTITITTTAAGTATAAAGRKRRRLVVAVEVSLLEKSEEGGGGRGRGRGRRRGGRRRRGRAEGGSGGRMMGPGATGATGTSHQVRPVDEVPTLELAAETSIPPSQKQQKQPTTASVSPRSTTSSTPSVSPASAASTSTPRSSTSTATSTKSTAATRSLIMPYRPPPDRPGYGRTGRPIALKANLFPVTLPRGEIYHYDVTIEPKCPKRVNRIVFEEVIRRNKKYDVAKFKPVFDGSKNMYTRGKLPIPEGKVCLCACLLFGHLCICLFVVCSIDCCVVCLCA